MPTDIRRVVTAQVGGKGVTVSDGSVPNIHAIGAGITVVDVWQTTEMPVVLPNSGKTPDGMPLLLNPPKRGTMLRFTEISPEGPGGIDKEAAAGILSTMSASNASIADGSDPLMHRTLSVDYGYIVDGEITLHMDDGDVTLGAGDFFIQQGASHAWRNRSGKACHMIVVMVDARDPGAAH